MALRKSSFNLTTPADHLSYLLKLPQEQRLQWLTRRALEDYPTLIHLENFLTKLPKESPQRNHLSFQIAEADLALVFKTTYILNNNYSDLSPAERQQFLRACSLQREIEIALTLLNRSNDLEKNLECISQDAAELAPALANKILTVVEYIKYFSVNYSGQQLTDFLQTLAIDPFTNEILQNPMITPHGITFSKSSLMSWFRPTYGPCNPICPITKQPLPIEAWLPNRLATKLQQLPLSLDYLQQIKEQLTCSLTNLPLIEPVVAADGETYELRAIEYYLANNDNKTPQGIEQDRPLYPNKLIRELLTIVLYTDQEYGILKNLNDYLRQVSKEPEPMLAWVGLVYSKEQKSKAMLQLITAMTKKEPANPLLIEGSLRAILEQGRAGDAAKPALNYLQQKHLQQIRVH